MKSLIQNILQTPADQIALYAVVILLSTLWIISVLRTDNED